MKIYEYGGKRWWFEEGKHPEGAVEVKQAEPKNKARTTRTKKKD